MADITNDLYKHCYDNLLDTFNSEYGYQMTQLEQCYEYLKFILLNKGFSMQNFCKSFLLECFNNDKLFTTMVNDNWGWDPTICLEEIHICAQTGEWKMVNHPETNN